MDPFKECSPEERAVLSEVMQDLHDSFKHLVLQRRGDKLKLDHDQLFSGTEQQGCTQSVFELCSHMHDRVYVRVQYAAIIACT